MAPVFFEMTRATTVHDKERALTAEIAGVVETALPGVEVLAVELANPTRFCVYIDREAGVDLELCARVSGLLHYSDRYTVDVSSPGLDRPLRKPEHFARFAGRQAAFRTERDIAGKTRFRGEIMAAGGESVAVSAAGETVEIPYGAIVRANLIDEG
jgi:ribosome maturation factor RimP